MTTILLATDGSPNAREALRVAIDICRATGARLEVLTVRTARRHGDAEGPLGERMDLQETAERIAREAVETAAAAGVEATGRTAFGDPASMIAYEAERLGADLVVVGSRGRGAIRGAILGSVSRKLLNRCPVPVTVARATEPHLAATAG